MSHHFKFVPAIFTIPSEECCRDLYISFLNRASHQCLGDCFPNRHFDQPLLTRDHAKSFSFQMFFYQQCSLQPEPHWKHGSALFPVCLRSENSESRAFLNADIIVVLKYSMDVQGFDTSELIGCHRPLSIWLLIRIAINENIYKWIKA